MAKCAVGLWPKSAVVLWLTLSAVNLLNSGCAGPAASRRSDSNPGASSNDAGNANDQNLPFHQNSVSDDSAHPGLPVSAKQSSDVPFHGAPRSRSIPAGTLISVRLEDPLPLTRSHAGDPFTASLVGPVTVEGVELLASGTRVQGRIESLERAAGRPGLMQLSLDGIIGNGATLPLETSGLFAEATAAKSSVVKGAARSDYSLAKGRRLTFRLTTPLTLPDDAAVVGR